MQRLRIALYSHDAMGLGHMRRNLLIANTLRRFPVRADVLLISGAQELNAFATPPGVDCVTLPGFTKTLRRMYVPRRLHMDRDVLSHMRARLIRAALDEFEPDVLIVDRHPRGLLNELDSTLDTLALRRHRPRILLGLRDVLDDPATVRREWIDEGAEQAVLAYYDAVLVYGDQHVYDPLAEYDFTREVAERLRFTGYLDPRLRYTRRVAQADDPLAAIPADAPLVLCQMGGGQDGARVAEAFAAAPLPRDAFGIIVTGPFMPSDARDRIRRMAATRRRMSVIDFLQDPERLLQRAQHVITMGGYNSVCEVLAAEKRALIVPRVAPRSEQLIRASRLHGLGLIDMLHPTQLTPAAIADWLEGSSYARAPVRRHAIDFSGLERLPRMLSEPARTGPDRPLTAVANAANFDFFLDEVGNG